MEFKLYQMDVKSAFLNGFVQEEVFVKQLPGVEDPYKPETCLQVRKSIVRTKA